MKNNRLTIKEIHEEIIAKKLTFSELAEWCNENTNKLIENSSNAILTNLNAEAIKKAKELDNKFINNKLDLNNYLLGIPCTLKDNICYENHKTTGGSLFLKDYVSPYSATVTKLLLSKNVLINSKTNMDELGLGGTGTFSGFGLINNTVYPNRITGGSSSGTVLAVKEKSAIFGIATDTGDSIRRPCSFMGLYGYKPTYGLVSRYGVLPYSPSLDHVGIVANCIEDIAIILDTIAYNDPKDYTNNKAININYFKNLNLLPKVKLALIKQVNELWDNLELKQKFNDLVDCLKRSSEFEIVEIDLDLDLIKVISSVYQVISYSEAVSSWNNLNGILFGNNQIEYKNWMDLMQKTRTKDLSYELKKRFVFGNYCTNASNFNKYYFKAKQLVDIYKNLFNEYFQKIDAFILPGASTIAPTVEDTLLGKSKSSYVDDLLEIANFTGAPSITIPYTTINDLPFGINLFANNQKDLELLNISLTLEKIIKG